MHTIINRLDAGILFKVMYLFNEGRLNNGDVKPFSDFYYSRWQTDEEIKEAFERLVGMQSDTGFLCRIESGNKIKILNKEPERIRAFFLNEVKKMLVNNTLKPADGEDLNECARLLKFKTQIELFTDYLRKQSLEEGDKFAIIRMRLSREAKYPYQRFCFDELLMHLEDKGIIEVKSRAEKKLKDDDTDQLLITPIVNIEFKPSLTFGDFKYDIIKNEIRFQDKSWRIKEGKGGERAVGIFLRELIEARGEFVKTKDIGSIIDSDKLGQYGKQISTIVNRIKKKSLQGWRKIKSDSGRDSKGYKLIT